MEHPPGDVDSPCLEFQPQLAAFALGEQPGAPDLIAHLGSCPDCRRDLAAYIQVAQALPYSAPLSQPSPGLRRRIIAAVEHGGHIPQPVQRPATRQQPPATRPRWPLAAMGALLALVLLFGWNMMLQREVQAQAQQVDASRAGWRTMTSLLNAKDLRWYTLSGGQARGHFWLAAGQPSACLVAEGMPALGPGQVYQVWLASNAQPRSGGTFNGRDGSGWVLVPDMGAPAQPLRVFVTIEPTGGSALPTGPEVLAGVVE